MIAQNDRWWLLACTLLGACATRVSAENAQDGSLPRTAGDARARSPAAKAPATQGAHPSAIQRMQEPGPEAQELARRAGVWDVVTTFRLTPDAGPTVSRGVIAERRMVGLFLEEVMKPAPGSDTADFHRISYLIYSRVEGRWQYVSLDTRLPVGIMPAQSFGKGTDRELTLQFEPLGFIGFGSEVEGRMIRSNLVITRDS